MGNKNSSKPKVIFSPLTIRDVPDAVDLHRRFINSAGAKLGSVYLHTLYETALSTPETHLMIGAYTDHRLIGLITVTNNAENSDRLLNRKIRAFIPILFSGIIRGKLSVFELFSRMMVHRKVEQLSAQRSLYVLSVVVHPQFQGQHIGSGLFENVYSLWKSETVLIDTLKQNTSAQQFYKKIGFKQICDVNDSIIYCRMTE